MATAPHVRLVRGGSGPRLDDSSRALDSLVRSARTPGRIAVLEGPPGAGRSALLFEAARALEGDRRPLLLRAEAVTERGPSASMLVAAGAGRAGADLERRTWDLVVGAALQGRPVVLLLDDADRLPAASLQRLLEWVTHPGIRVSLVACVRSWRALREIVSAYCCCVDFVRVGGSDRRTEDGLEPRPSRGSRRSRAPVPDAGAGARLAARRPPGAEEGAGPERGAIEAEPARSTGPVAFIEPVPVVELAPVAEIERPAEAVPFIEAVPIVELAPPAAPEASAAEGAFIEPVPVVELASVAEPPEPPQEPPGSLEPSGEADRQAGPTWTIEALLGDVPTPDEATPSSGRPREEPEAPPVPAQEPVEGADRRLALPSGHSRAIRQRWAHAVPDDAAWRREVRGVSRAPVRGQVGGAAAAPAPAILRRAVLALAVIVVLAFTMSVLQVVLTARETMRLFGSASASRIEPTEPMPGRDARTRGAAAAPGDSGTASSSAPRERGEGAPVARSVGEAFELLAAGTDPEDYAAARAFLAQRGPDAEAYELLADLESRFEPDPVQAAEQLQARSRVRRALCEAWADDPRGEAPVRLGCPGVETRAR